MARPPKIDPTQPLVNLALQIYASQAAAAYEFSIANDDAVRPIFAQDPRGRGFRQIGSCVLLRVADQVFALSASHVFDNVGTYQVVIGCGDRLYSLVGERFSTRQGKSGTHRDDPIDASVVHLSGEIPDLIRSCALTLADLDFRVGGRSEEFHVLMGYRASKSKSTSEAHMAHLDRYPSREVDDAHYEHLKRKRDVHLVLAFEDHTFTNGSWHVAPSLHGVSGGAIFRMPGLNPLYSNIRTRGQSKLAAIFIERTKATSREFHSVAVGTRCAMHLSLIRKYLPELGLEELIEEEHRRQSLLENW